MFVSSRWGFTVMYVRMYEYLPTHCHGYLGLFVYIFAYKTAGTLVHTYISYLKALG